jgi:hypothetical protein
MPTLKVTKIVCHDEQDTEFFATDEITLHLLPENGGVTTRDYDGMDTNDKVSPNVKVDFDKYVDVTLFERDGSGWQVDIGSRRVTYDAALDHVPQDVTFQNNGGEYTVTYEIWA